MRRRHYLGILAPLVLGVVTAMLVSAAARGASGDPPSGSIATKPPPAAGIGALPPPPGALPARERKILQGLRFAEFLMHVERDFGGAGAEYEKVLRLDRKRRDALIGLAGAYTKAADWKKATMALERAAKTLPKDKQVWAALGSAYVKAGDESRALRAFEKALALDATFAPALLEAGDLHWSASARTKDAATKEKALALYERYLRATPEDRGPMAERIRRLVTEARDGPAAATFLDARGLYEKAFTTRGRMSILFDEAYSKLEAVLREKPGYAPALYYQGLIHLSIKSRALHDVDKALAKLAAAGKHAPSLTVLGRHYRTEDDVEKALGYLTQAVEADERYQMAWYEAGVAYNLSGKREEAVRTFRRAVDLDGRSDMAAKAVVELSKLAPNDPRVMAHYQQSGRFKADVFNTEKFKGSIRMLEERLGGVVETAPEQAWLDVMMRRLLAAGVSTEKMFQVRVVRTGMVNAFAVPNGNVYFTRGFFDFIAKAFPDQPMSADNAAIAAVMGHEITHVLKEHVIRSFVFRDAMNTGRFTPDSLVSVTRTHEVEADREGMRTMFLAGYDPRMAVRLHAEYAKTLGEVPGGLDHPTFDERIHYLEEYWSNEMAFAYASFEQGAARLEEAQNIEAADINKAAALYQEAMDDLKRFATAFERTKEALNNLALASTKLGLFEIARSGQSNPLTRWYTELSVERELALRFVPLSGQHRTRGAGGDASDVVPAAIRQARVYLEEALKRDPGYARARLNLAVVLLAAGELEQAGAALATVLGGCDGDGKDTGADGAGRLCSVQRPQIRNLAGIVLAEQGKLDEALEHFEKSIEGQPPEKSPFGVFNLARALDKAERKADAIDAYQRFLTTVGEKDTSGWSKQARDALARLKE